MDAPLDPTNANGLICEALVAPLDFPTAGGAGVLCALFGESAAEVEDGLLKAANEE